MQLIINGKTVELEVRTITDIIAHYDLEHRLVMVECDDAIVDREQWEQTHVTAGQRIELVHFVGGG